MAVAGTPFLSSEPTAEFVVVPRALAAVWRCRQNGSSFKVRPEGGEPEDLPAFLTGCALQMKKAAGGRTPRRFDARLLHLRHLLCGGKQGGARPDFWT